MIKLNFVISLTLISINMKKLLLITGSFIFLTLTSQAQLANRDYLKEMAPAHIQQRMDNEKLANLSYSMDKNNSFDNPLSIEYYSVDIANVETLESVYEFTYTSAGRLLYKTTLDATMTNLYRTKYNFTYFGEISSSINQVWNGWGWDFTSRTIYTYTESLVLGEIRYEDYNDITNEWEFDYGNKFTYVGGGTAPSSLTVSTSDDDITWTDNTRINFTYGSSSTPEVINIMYYDDNFLAWYQGEIWEVTEWGPNPFKADFLFNTHDGQNKITDNTIGKLDNFMIYPKDFIYHSSYDEMIGEFGYITKVESEFDGNNRTVFAINDYNGTSYDSTTRYDVTYDVCYGLDEYINTDYVSPGVWTIAYGYQFDGSKVPYSSSCYVNAYDYYSNFSDTEPNGIRTKRWVINQASELSIDDLDPFASLTVYPNPAANELTVSSLVDVTSESTLTIMGVDGKVLNVTDWESTVQTVDISSLPSGIYILQLNMNNDIAVRKFVKE